MVEDIERSPHPRFAPPFEQGEAVADLYSRAAPIYTEQGPPYFAHAGRRLVELARVVAGDAILVGTPGIRKPGALATALEQGGLVDGADIEEEVQLFYASPGAWWDSLWAHGPRRPLERMPPEVLAGIRVECLERVRMLVQPEGVPELVRFAFVLARTPVGTV